MDKYGWNCKTKLEHYCALFEFSASRQGETELLFRRKKKSSARYFSLVNPWVQEDSHIECQK